jgi:hypothetical protein
MQIEWIDSSEVRAWNKLLIQCPKCNWMQTMEYHLAQLKCDYKSTRYGFIKKSQEVIGLFSQQEIKLGPVHIIEFNRAPIWLAGYESDENLVAFAKLLAKNYPKRIFRLRRWIVEGVYSQEALEQILKLGFVMSNKTFETSILSLKPSIEELLKNIHPKWRNSLAKAQRENLACKRVVDNFLFTSFLDGYRQHLSTKAYLGMSSQFVVQEVNCGSLNEQILLIAIKDETPIAGVWMSISGRQCNYRIGWNTAQGRQSNAHYFLIWESIKIAKQLGLLSLDLGGLLPGHESGLNLFKLRMGGKHYQSLGVFK